MAQPSTQACRPLNLFICSLYLPALSARSSSLPQTTGFLCAHLNDKPSVGEGVCVSLVPSAAAGSVVCNEVDLFRLSK